MNSVEGGAQTASVGSSQQAFSVWQALLNHPASGMGAAVIVLFLFVAVFAPWLAPYSPTEISPLRLSPPSAAHWFGTDQLGRDVFARVLLGTQSVLLLAGLGTALAVLLGTALGLFSGYRGGWFDEILMRVFDSLLAMPALLLALLLLGTAGPAQQNVGLVLVVVYTPIVARVVRSEVLHLKTKGFVEAARLQGESTAYIVFGEVLPSVLPALSVEAAMRFTYAIFLVASLGFLGVGVQPPSSNWGLMVNEARDFARTAPWTLWFPAGAISLLVVGMNLLADGVKRALRGGDFGQTTLIGKIPFVAQENREAVAVSMPPDAAAVVTLERLGVGYRQNDRTLPALREVSLSLVPGQTYGLVGESGSGKSTLALALMGYLPENARIETGRITVDGHPVHRLDREGLRALWGVTMSLVPQDPLASLNPSLRIGTQLAEALQRQEVPNKAQLRQRILTLLAQVKITDPQRVAASYPHQLSGGMQQRVMIAMALSANPKLLVLDEPTTGLDVTTEAAVLDLFKTLMRTRQTATLYISHDLGVVSRFADRVAVLYAGELVEDAPTAALYERPLHPYTQGLLASIPHPGQHKRQLQLNAMRGQIPSLAELPQGCVFAPRCPLATATCKRQPELRWVDERKIHRVRCHHWRQAAGFAAARPAKVAPLPEISPTPVLAVKGLKKQFGPLRALDGVDLTLHPGQTLGLVGESGSGKSTLARTLVGLESATAGTIQLLEKYLPTKLSKRDRNTLRQLQMVFQNPQDALNPHKTIGQTLRRTLRRLGGQSAESARHGALRLLQQVRLEAAYAGRLPAQLSGGEKQRVAIARAFAAEPKVVVCDEPTSALDVSVQARILNLLVELQQVRQTAYLFISHDLAVVGFLADRVAVMYLGCLMQVGSSKTFLTPPHHPYTEALLASASGVTADGRAAAVRLKENISSPGQPLQGCPFHTRCPRALEVCARQLPPWQEGQQGKRILCHIPLVQLEKRQAGGWQP